MISVVFFYLKFLLTSQYKTSLILNFKISTPRQAIYGADPINDHPLTNIFNFTFALI